MSSDSINDQSEADELNEQVLQCINGRQTEH